MSPISYVKIVTCLAATFLLGLYVQQFATERIFRDTSPKSSWPERDVISYRKSLLIVAYMRTGSSLTGKIFEEYPGTFYLFEPLKGVTDKYKESNSTITLEYPTGNTKNYSAEDKARVILHEVSAWLDCELYKLSTTSLMALFNRKHTQYMGQFVRCVEKQRKSVSTLKALNICLDQAVMQCQNSPNVALKFIRLPMEYVKELLPLFPNMKVLHLVRDPRGILNSRVHLPNALVSGSFEKTYEYMCQEYFSNLVAFKEISVKFPGRLKLFRYEDLAAHPLRTAQEMYEFSELDFTAGVREFVSQMTSSKHNGCPYCVNRKSSNASATRWRSELSFLKATQVYLACNRSNAIFGYLPFRSENEMKDVNIPSYGKYVHV